MSILQKHMTVKGFFKTYPIKTHYLANKAGISPGTMRHYAYGGKVPSKKAIGKINIAIQLIAKELMGASVCDRT